jgi:hypothetical protein
LSPFQVFFLQLEPEPFRHPLLHPADKNGGRADSPNVGGFVGGEQRDALVGQFPFQPHRIVEIAGGAFDVFDHHGSEPGLRGPGLRQQVSQAPVPGDALTGELLVAAVAALFQVQGTGLHIPVVPGHVEAGRQPLMSRRDLAAQAGRRILQHEGRRAGEDSNRDGLNGASCSGHFMLLDYPVFLFQFYLLMRRVLIVLH